MQTLLNRRNNFLLPLLILPLFYAHLFAATVSGKVTNQNDDPVPYAQLQFNPVSVDSSSAIFGRRVDIKADAEGNYTATLEEGNWGAYFLDYRFSDWQQYATIEISTPDEGRTLNIQAEQIYFANASISGNLVIVDASGEETPFANRALVMRAVPDDLPEDAITDTLEYSFSNDRPDFVYIMTDAAGNYTFPVIAGKYVIRVPMLEDNFEYISPVIEINESETLLYNIELSARVPLTISGTVSNYDPSTMRVLVQAIRMGWWRYYVTELDESGNYSLDLNPDVYIIEFVYFNRDLPTRPYAQAFYREEGEEKPYTELKLTDRSIDNINIDAPDPEEPNVFTITGQVTGADNQEPIAGAQIFVSGPLRRSYDSDSADVGIPEIFTDEEGNYSISGEFYRDSIRVIVSSSAENYQMQFYKDKDYAFFADRIVITAGDTVKNVNFALRQVPAPSEFTISGKIQLEADSADFEWNSVVAYDIDRRRITSISYVNGDGTYSLTGFTGGETVVVQAWDNRGMPKFYDNVYRWRDATPLTVNGNITGIDYNLDSVSGNQSIGRVNGVITLSKAGKRDGDFNSATILLRRTGHSDWFSAALSEENGAFSVPTGAYGYYDMIVTMPGYEDYETQFELNENTGLDISVDEIVLDATTSVDDDPRQLPVTIALANAYPNPFNPSTTIAVRMQKPGQAALVVYNATGQKVKTLFQGQLQAGQNDFTWNGTNDAGAQVASGMYFYQLQAAGIVQTKSMILLK
jgi:hypothetical protein